MLAHPDLIPAIPISSERREVLNRCRVVATNVIQKLTYCAKNNFSISVHSYRMYVMCFLHNNADCHTLWRTAIRFARGFLHYHEILFRLFVLRSFSLSFCLQNLHFLSKSIPFRTISPTIVITGINVFYTKNRSFNLFSIAYDIFFRRKNLTHVLLETPIARITLSGYEVQGAISIPCPLYARLDEASGSLNFRYHSLFSLSFLQYILIIPSRR